MRAESDPPSIHDRCGAAGLGLVMGLVIGALTWVVLAFGLGRLASAPLTLFGTAFGGGVLGFVRPFGALAIIEHALHFVAGMLAVASIGGRDRVHVALLRSGARGEAGDNPLRSRSLDAALVAGGLLALALWFGTRVVR